MPLGETLAAWHQSTNVELSWLPCNVQRWRTVLNLYKTSTCLEVTLKLRCLQTSSCPGGNTISQPKLYFIMDGSVGVTLP